MKLLRIIPVLLVSLCSLSSANAITLIGTGSPILTVPDSGIVLDESGAGDTDISQWTTEIQLSGDYNIYTDGDMFLDYSVFSDNQDLFIGSNISITGQTVTIFAFNDSPTLPVLSNTSIFTNSAYSMNEVGNVLLFSEAPILSGAFEATGNLYIGNYSSLSLSRYLLQWYRYSLVWLCSVVEQPLTIALTRTAQKDAPPVKRGVRLNHGELNYELFFSRYFVNDITFWLCSLKFQFEICFI